MTDISSAECSCRRP